jgi:toxin ParE1/3/4
VARHTVVFDRDARADLGGIRDYIAKARDDEFAEAFVRRVILYCESFATIPHRGTKRDKIRPGLRTITWRRTITIAFIVSDATKQVVILGAFYRGRDVLSALKQRQPQPRTD